MFEKKLLRILEEISNYYTETCPKEVVCGKIQCEGKCCNTYLEAYPLEVWLILKRYKSKLMKSKSILTSKALIRAPFEHISKGALNHLQDPCIFLQNGKCSIYEIRPTLCSRFFVKEEVHCHIENTTPTLFTYEGSIENTLELLNEFLFGTKKMNELHNGILLMLTHDIQPRFDGLKMSDLDMFIDHIVNLPRIDFSEVKTMKMRDFSKMK